MMSRTTEAVIRDHLERRREGELEEDLARNYSEDLVVLSKARRNPRAGLMPKAMIPGIGDRLRMVPPSAILKLSGRCRAINPGYTLSECATNQV